MAVLVEALSVIVRLSTVRDKYPGGYDAYREHCPNGTFCADGHLARIGFMVPDDVHGFVERLEERGLVGIRDGDAIDLVVIDQFRGPTTQCGWIDVGTHPDGYAGAWLEGTEPGTLYAPLGWTIGQSRRMKFTAAADAAEKMTPLASEDGLDVMLDLETGQQRYVGRVHGGRDSRELSERQLQT